MNLYFLKHTVDETELCQLEKKCLFNTTTERNYFFIENYIDVNRSPFVKYCLKDIIFSDSLEGLVRRIISENITYENFKVKYLVIDEEIEFEKRHEIEGIIGYEINGFARVDSPDIILGVTSIGGSWIMGEYLKNNAKWKEHMNRPQDYCNALPTRVSRAIVNIAVGNDISCKVIDPCCGIGTIVMEALSMGIDITGVDINYSISEGAKRNLSYFDYPDVIKRGDIHEISGHYDIAIIDLPYGILSKISRNDQLDIIKSAGLLADKIAVVGVEDLTEELIKMDFFILEKCIIAKGKFKRHLYICRRNMF